MYNSQLDIEATAPWRSPLARALHRNGSQPYSRYFQLATVQTDGRPVNRTVVFRGFITETNLVKMITDNRTQKIEQILYQPWAEICWYFSNTREQFRIAGKLTLIDAGHPEIELQKARQLSWQELSENARLQLAWPHPGQPRANSQAFSPPLPSSIEPLENFCLLLLNPVKVDHLELRGNPQNRWLYSRDDSQNWSVEEVNP